MTYGRCQYCNRVRQLKLRTDQDFPRLPGFSSSPMCAQCALEAATLIAASAFTTTKKEVPHEHR